MDILGKIGSIFFLNWPSEPLQTFTFAFCVQYLFYLLPPLAFLLFSVFFPIFYATYPFRIKPLILFYAHLFILWFSSTFFSFPVELHNL